MDECAVRGDARTGTRKAKRCQAPRRALTKLTVLCARNSPRRHAVIEKRPPVASALVRRSRLLLDRSVTDVPARPTSRARDFSRYSLCSPWQPMIGTLSGQLWLKVDGDRTEVRVELANSASARLSQYAAVMLVTARGVRRKCMHEE